MTTKYIHDELVIIVKYQLLVHIHPLNAKCMHLGLPSQGANNVVHVRAIGGGTSERSCMHVGMNFSVDSQYQFQATSKVT